MPFQTFHRVVRTGWMKTTVSAQKGTESDLIQPDKSSGQPGKPGEWPVFTSLDHDDHSNSKLRIWLSSPCFLRYCRVSFCSSSSKRDRKLRGSNWTGLLRVRTTMSMAGSAMRCRRNDSRSWRRKAFRLAAVLTFFLLMTNPMRGCARSLSRASNNSASLPAL